MYYEYTSSATLQTFMILVLYKSKILFAKCQEFEHDYYFMLYESMFNYNNCNYARVIMENRVDTLVIFSRTFKLSTISLLKVTNYATQQLNIVSI